MPDIAASLYSPRLLVVRGSLNAVDYPLGRNNLIGSHDKQEIFRSEHTVLRQDIEKRMLGKECLCEVNQIRNDVVLAVRPERSELEAVACVFRGPSPIQFPYMAVSCCVGIVLGVCSIGDDEYLDILIKPTGCPEAIPLIAVYLIECLLDGDTAPFQLNMHKRKAID